MNTPEFSSPPVVETGIGLQFKELPGFKNIHFGRLFTKLQDRWNTADDAPRWHPIPKNLAVNVPITGFTFTTNPSCNRVQFRSKDRPDIMFQVQPDRIGFNWRGVDDRPYPRFDENFQVFKDDLESFKEFLGEEELGPLVPDVAEVVYVNRVVAIEGHDLSTMASETFVEIGSPVAGLPSPTTFSYRRLYSLDDNRSSISFSADTVSETEMVFRAIGRCRCDPESSIENVISRAHELAVDAFVKHTTPEVQKKWGRVDE